MTIAHRDPTIKNNNQLMMVTQKKDVVGSGGVVSEVGEEERQGQQQCRGGTRSATNLMRRHGNDEDDIAAIARDQPNDGESRRECNGNAGASESVGGNKGGGGRVWGARLGILPVYYSGIPIFLPILDPSFLEFYLFPFSSHRKTVVAGTYSDNVM
jgi:hypothetical protein